MLYNILNGEVVLHVGSKISLLEIAFLPKAYSNLLGFRIKTEI